MGKPPLSPDHYTAEAVVRLLGLEPIDREGGFFRRTAESAHVLPGVDRRAYSAIYSLVTPEGFSALHRLQHDEIWCFHAGDSLESLQLSVDGRGGWSRLGLDVAGGDQPQMVVAGGTWQGTRLLPGGRWALSSCIVSPGFSWSDFKLGAVEDLAPAYPAFAGEIKALTRVQPPAGHR